ncbi:Nitrosoguanidine resistance protein SNG1 [Candida viswanathii]|uniref:Nitrosoguanidine resistance protein SNG1 n=1 Tax=Candida viswanathii TaxID=5486 RepID=A0A367YKZ0_9ASCO|nr:Nitrosoguanidine resistance protein SNG1 [Candida viswanathii]
MPDQENSDGGEAVSPQLREGQDQSPQPPNDRRNFSLSSINFFRRNTETGAQPLATAGQIGEEEEGEDDDSIASLNDNNYMEELYGIPQVYSAMTNRSTRDEERGTLNAPKLKTQEENDSSDTYQEGDGEKPLTQPSGEASPQGPPPPPPPIQPQLSRRRSSIASTLEKVKKYRWWDDEFKYERSKIIGKFLINYVFLVIGFAGVLCIYTGSYYDRTSRFKDLKMGVIIADQNMGDLPNIVGQTVEYYFTEVPAVQAMGDFHFWNYTMISDLAESNNRTIRQEVEHQIHHQRYWCTFYVHENATLDWYQALVSQSQDFSPVTGLMEVVFETGRDYMAVYNYVTTIINELLLSFNSFAPKSGLVSKMLETLNETQAFDVMENAPHLISAIPNFDKNDLHPVPNPLFQAAMTLGGVYSIIMTFFGQIFCLEINMYLATKVTGALFVVFKILTTQISYVFISLGYVVLNTAFRLPFNVTFGHSGFLVLWCFSFLLMSSLGSIIEVLVLICFATTPPFLGFVLVYMVVINLSPTVSPIVLCPKFYRYGYAIPLKNFYDLLQVAYFNAWKAHVGRNVGVLLAWIIVSNACLPFAMKWLANKKAKDEEKKKLEKEGR